MNKQLKFQNLNILIKIMIRKLKIKKFIKNY